MRASSSLYLALWLPALSVGRPYSLRLELDAPLIAGFLAMKQHSDQLLAETRKSRFDVSTLDRRDIPGFDRWAIGFYSPRLSEFSSVVVWSQLAIPVAANAWGAARGDNFFQSMLTDMVLLQEAALLSSSLSSYAKSTPAHSTPMAYDASVPLAERSGPANISSFFSGHTTSAFTTAVFSAYTFQLRHPESPFVPWMWGGSLALATGVGSMRVLAGKHFPSDVLVGAAVGALCGYIVPALHTRRARLRGESTSRRSSDARGPDLNWSLGLTFPEGSPTPAPTVMVDF